MIRSFIYATNDLLLQLGPWTPRPQLLDLENHLYLKLLTSGVALASLGAARTLAKSRQLEQLSRHIRKKGISLNFLEIP